MGYVACVICYTGIERQNAQGVLRYLLGRMLSAHVSQSLVHMGRRRSSSLVHTSLWRSAHGLHFMSSISLASLYAYVQCLVVYRFQKLL